LGLCAAALVRARIPSVAERDVNQRVQSALNRQCAWKA
jgi:hypothetical protein